jgi:carotenoid cleavage dioxygenase-like enzyme
MLCQGGNSFCICADVSNHFSVTMQAEDDGVVLSFVAAAEGGSFLLVLDAERFEEVARVGMPHGIPYAFHGTFVPADGSLPINKG